MHPLFLKISFAGYGILGSYFFVEYFKYVTPSISLESIDKSWSFCFLLSCPLYLPFLFNLVTVLTCDEVIVRQGEVMYLKSLKYHTVVSQWCNGTSFDTLHTIASSGTKALNRPWLSLLETLLVVLSFKQDEADCCTALKFLPLGCSFFPLDVAFSLHPIGFRYWGNTAHHALGRSCSCCSFTKKYCSSLKDSTVIKLKHYFTCEVLMKLPWIKNKHFLLCILSFLILQYLSFPIFFGHIIYFWTYIIYLDVYNTSKNIIYLKILESRISIFCMSFPLQYKMHVLA